MATTTPLTSSAAARPVSARASRPSTVGVPVPADRGNRVQVAVRIRPTNRSDGPDARVAVRRDDYDAGSILVDDGKRGRNYSFDHVFCGSQEEVYRSIGAPMLDEAYKGFNVCLFAYGQTGSGKTYSIQGDADDEATLGVIPRFVFEMFARAQQMVEEDPRLTIKFTLSYLEIYMEKIRDLLAVRVKGQEPESLELHEDAAKRVYVKDIGVHSVLSAERVTELLAAGNENRQTAETRMNEFSSRSHSIVQLTVSQFHEDMDRRDIESVVSLVDLAGSERQSKAETTGLQFEEAKRINQSLLMLGRALNSFSDGKSDFISLRESKLTRLLSESFGGNSKTWMLATVSPAAFNLQESISTLDYATNAKKIENRAEINKMARQLELKDLRELTATLQKSLETERSRSLDVSRRLKDLEDENTRLREQLEQRSDQSRLEVYVAEAIAEHDHLMEQLDALLRSQAREKALDRAINRTALNPTYVGKVVCSLSKLIHSTFDYMTLILPTDGDHNGQPPTLVVHLYYVKEHESDALIRPPGWEGQDILNLQVSIVEVENLPARCNGGAQVSFFFKCQEGDVTTSPLVTESPQNAKFNFHQKFLFGPRTKPLMDYFADDVLNFVVTGFSAR